LNLKPALFRGRCGQFSPLIHDRRIRLVRDRDLFDQRVLLQLPVRRVDCLSCGRVTERIDWLEPASRLTQRLRIWLESLLRLLPISHVSQLTGLHWHTLKTLDKRRLQAEVGNFDSTGVRRLVMDEFALHKGHRYATVIMDAERTRVLWVGHGNSREAVRPFFELLGKHCQQIEAVAMDMNTAFDLEVKKHCPQAEVVYDLFHVVARYGRDVIDRIRVTRPTSCAKTSRHERRSSKAAGCCCAIATT
jgi:transposase